MSILTENQKKILAFIADDKAVAGHFLDPLQLAEQFVKAETFKDYPKMHLSISEKEWQSFFLSEAKRLGKTQIE